MSDTAWMGKLFWHAETIQEYILQHVSLRIHMNMNIYNKKMKILKLFTLLKTIYCVELVRGWRVAVVNCTAKGEVKLLLCRLSLSNRWNNAVTRQTNHAVVWILDTGYLYTWTCFVWMTIFKSLNINFL